jgi:D-alanyl-D-alanine carboxypeptidase
VSESDVAIEPEARDEIGRRLRKTVERSKQLRNALLLVHSDGLQIHWTYAFGTTGPSQGPISPDTPYHIASIGKTFTSTLIARLHEGRQLSFDDPIAEYLSPEMLDGLFVYRGTDYAHDVTVGQLLNHTSGVGDYFEDKPISGKSIQELAVDEPDRFWTPDETIDYTRRNQRAFAPPGERFHYSDTGYNLLGKIVEEVTGRPFHENLHAEIFNPLGMDHSYFLFYSEPKHKSAGKFADVFLGDHEVSTYRSLSIDWAGGGIVSTTEDLLRFHQALVNRTLIREETFARWRADTGRFGFGMDYGYGVLFLNVGKMTLFMPKKLNMWGNLGSIGAYMFYNPTYDVYLIGSFNHSSYVAKQVFFLIKTMRFISKAVG